MRILSVPSATLEYNSSDDTLLIHKVERSQPSNSQEFFITSIKRVSISSCVARPSVNFTKRFAFADSSDASLNAFCTSFSFLSIVSILFRLFSISLACFSAAFKLSNPTPILTDIDRRISSSDLVKTASSFFLLTFLFIS